LLVVKSDSAGWLEDASTLDDAQARIKLKAQKEDLYVSQILLEPLEGLLTALNPSFAGWDLSCCMNNFPRKS